MRVKISMNSARRPSPPRYGGVLTCTQQAYRLVNTCSVGRDAIQPMTDKKSITSASSSARERRRLIAHCRMYRNELSHDRQTETVDVCSAAATN